MKKIGEGYYYNVYDIGNNRVYKKQKSKIRIFLFILFSRIFHPDFFREYKNVINSTEKIKSNYIKLEKICKDLSLLGNPKFTKNSTEYEQDKALILKKHFKNIDKESKKEIIEKFILLIKTLWTYGVSDIVFNFTINNGVDKYGNIILIDFNEVTFEKEEVKDCIKNEIWLNRYSFYFLDKDIKPYYRERMHEELNLESLNKLWESNLRL